MMTALNIVAVIGGLIIMYIVKDFFTVSGRFWKLVARQPDRALWLFMVDPDCVLDAKPAASKQYVGPFRFCDLRGKLHCVYICSAHIAEKQSSWMQPLGMNDASFAAWAKRHSERGGEASSNATARSY